jgi:hypothetical protein
MNRVFLLWHHYPDDPDDPDDDNAKLLGVYSSEEIAELRREEKYKQLPGFSRGDGEFVIDSYEIDQDQWNEGFFRSNEE